MRTRLGIAISATLVSIHSNAAITEDFRCLSTSSAKPVSVEFRMLGKAEVSLNVGYVLYKGAKQAIPIVLAKSAVTDKPPNRPWAFEDTWVEVLGGKVTGTYTVSHQGANIDGFIYKAARDGKETVFEQDLQHTGESACQW